MSSLGDRLAASAEVTAVLAPMSDSEMSDLLRRCAGQKVGIGGSTYVIRIAGISVFVKLIRGTDLERDAGSGCTANLFDLPTWYQYGVGEGSTGLNAWREVVAHQTASGWVVNGDPASFPLLYHWRELPRQRCMDAAADPADIDRVGAILAQLTCRRDTIAGDFLSRARWSRCSSSTFRSCFAAG